MAGLIGVFGGTFDPPHLGHLILSEHAQEELQLDLVLWVLTPRSPLKAQGDPAPVEIRTQLVEAAIADAPRFRLSKVDIDRPPPYYAVETIELLRRAEPGAEFIYLLGSDSLADLPRWHEPARFVGLCAGLGVMERPGQAPDLPGLERTIPGITMKIRPFRAPQVEISARAIRERAAGGRSIRYLVPDSVGQLILKEGLYRE
jgi:nicotinate-nucleotide adenylyltransferase